MPKNIKKILHQLEKELTQIYGEQLKAVILFGSFARGEGRLPDSDIDVMIVLKAEFDYWNASRRSSELGASLSLENDVVISRKFVSASVYANSRMPLYVNVRKEGATV